MFPLHLQVGILRKLWCFKRAKVLNAPVNHDGRSPFFSVLTNSKQTGLTAFRRAVHVLHVHAFASRPKIAKPVVASIPVHVVNALCGPIAVNVQPNKSMGLVVPTVHANHYIPVCGYTSGNVSGFVLAVGQGNPPSQKPTIGRVIQKFAHALRGKIGLSHDAPRKLIGQRPACVDSTCGLRHFSSPHA